MHCSGTRQQSKRIVALAQEIRKGLVKDSIERLKGQPVTRGWKLCPQSHTIRLAGSSRLHRGQRFFHCMMGFALAARSFGRGVILSARETAHCG